MKISTTKNMKKMKKGSDYSYLLLDTVLVILLWC